MGLYHDGATDAGEAVTGASCTLADPTPGEISICSANLSFTLNSLDSLSLLVTPDPSGGFTGISACVVLQQN